MELELKNKQSLAISKLYNATLIGDIPSLFDVLKDDELILDRCIIEKSSRYMQSPLHVAASKGHVEMVQTMLKQRPKLCFVRDQDGMNPIHVACVEGHIGVVEMLYNKSSHAARERTNSGETVLHLCVKHNHLEALEKVLELINDDEFLNSKDGDGNTVLHLAVIGEQVEMVKLISEQSRMNKNAINNNGLTPLDCCNNKKDMKSEEDVVRIHEIWVSLTYAKGLRAKDVLRIQNRAWVEKQSQALMVVASLIATMAFQVVLSPPGGFWQDNKLPEPNVNTSNMSLEEFSSKYHAAGSPIAAGLVPRLFTQLMVWNTIALVTSLIVILLLISGLPSVRFFVELLRITMWISVTATTATYSVSLASISDWNFQPGFVELSFKPNDSVNIVWKVVVAIMLVGRFLHFLGNVIKRRPSIWQLFTKFIRRFPISLVNHLV